MSRTLAHADQARFQTAPIGLVARFAVFFIGLTRAEPAAVQVYAKNEQLRFTGRNWLM
jgi:hypothetical protein